MLNSIKRTVGSGGKKYDVTVSFDGLTDEQIQGDAMSFYVWKIQRQIRDASEMEREAWLENGISLHANEVGKPIVTTEQIIDGMSPEQAKKALELLEKKLGA